VSATNINATIKNTKIEATIKGGLGGSVTFEGLQDVNIDSVTDAELIVYDSATSKFVNKTTTELGISTGAQSHDHDDRYYTETETDTLLAAKADTTHNHDDRYYTESETDTLLAAKAATSHSHDDLYYTESETDSLLNAKANTSHNHSAADLTSGTLADARVAETNVTQHEAAIDHDVLTNYSADQHRTINDAGSTTTDLWSASKINTELSGKANTSHSHNDLYYTESEVDTLLNAKANTSHNHSAADLTSGTLADARVAQSNVTQHVGALDHDSLLNYSLDEHRVINDAGTATTDLWSGSKINTELGSKADASHTHTISDITDFGSYLENLVEDTSPQLGGQLDANDNNIINILRTVFKGNQSNPAIAITQTVSTTQSPVTGGVINLTNTGNNSEAIVVYTNNGATQEGHLVNLTSANSAFDKSLAYIDYTGSSHALELLYKSDSLKSGVNIASDNTTFSAVQIAGTELSHGTLKLRHDKPSGASGNDSSASALSVLLTGTNTAARGIFVDTQEATTGDLMTLRQLGVAKFTVDDEGAVFGKDDITIDGTSYLKGNLYFGATGVNTSVYKYGNSANDHFYIGSTGAFRVQRASGGSEAFRIQISGDTQGRILVDSTGRLKFGSGSATQDAWLSRPSTNILRVSSNGSTGTCHLQVSGDMESLSSSRGVILLSPDGTRWRVKIDNLGMLTTTSL
jgi:hypothetical protein